VPWQVFTDLLQCLPRHSAPKAALVAPMAPEQ